MSTLDPKQRLTRVDGRVHFYGMELPDGPWHSEPDRVEFEHAGFSCLLLRNRLGAWCGYVAMPSGHPWHGKEYGDDYDALAAAHDAAWWGLTYSASCAGEICHVTKPGEADDVWWLGFDCIHAGDASLSDIAWTLDPTWASKFGTTPSGEYRTVEHVRRHTQRLADAAKAVRS